MVSAGVLYPVLSRSRGGGGVANCALSRRSEQVQDIRDDSFATEDKISIQSDLNYIGLQR